MKDFYRKKGLKLVVEIKQRDGFIRKIHLRESYIVGVLGVQRKVLFESLVDSSLQKIIIKEHLLFEGWWDSAKKFVGDSIENITKKFHDVSEILKEYGEKAEGAIAALWACVKDGNALEKLKSGAFNLMEKAIQATKRRLYILSNEMKDNGMEKIANYIKIVIDKIYDIKEKISSTEGWKGLLTTLAAYLGFSFVREKIVRFVDSSPIEKLKKMSSTSIQEIIESIPNFFKENISEVAGDAIEKLSGPVAWINKIILIFKSSQWVFEHILDALRRGNFTFSVTPQSTQKLSLDKKNK